MNRPLRILVATAGLAAAGAVLGALAAVAALTVGVMISNRTIGIPIAGVLSFAAVFGAVLGAVAAPAAGWLLLRRVPLGLAAGGAVLGTVAGGVAGWALPFFRHDQVGGGVLGAGIGFVVAALVLRIRAGRVADRARVDAPP